MGSWASLETSAHHITCGSWAFVIVVEPKPRRLGAVPAGAPFITVGRSHGHRFEYGFLVLNGDDPTLGMVLAADDNSLWENFSPFLNDSEVLPEAAEDTFCSKMISELEGLEQCADDHSYAALSPLSSSREGSLSHGSNSPTNTSCSEASYPLDILEAASQELFTQTSFDDDIKPFQSGTCDSLSAAPSQYGTYRVQPSPAQQRRSPTFTGRPITTQRPSPIIKFKPALRNPADISLNAPSTFSSTSITTVGTAHNCSIIKTPNGERQRKYPL
ncbi:hypothetical protein KIN20_034806 [Parelaphostrongylus tenuis]|uniref:Uncharacterized protein n=1 Tax=Parelaphostrongylus tenuis TaxID=148309 RepID=A0AAD5RA85_PARTN|nr:hypothetical protein KIN20_034806 [Parelaphostrongylus tenuis]